MMKAALLLLLVNHGSLIVSAWLPTKAVWNSNNNNKNTQRPSLQRTSTTSSFTRLSSTAASSSSSSSTTSFALPQLDVSHIQDLAKQGYVIIPNFLSESLQAALRDDIYHLRSQNYFKQAKIGQDATNALNRNIRVAETCFLSQFNNNNNNNNNDDTTTSSSSARSQLLQLLQQIPLDLQAHADLLGHADAKTRHIPTQQLDTNQATWLTSQTGGLHEWLYAYYPQGGFYRRHVDALPGSASTLRCYSLLLYLNDNQIWKQQQSESQKNNGGQLRLHFDSGRDELPDGESPNYLDVDPYGGTLVLFSSRDIPHEVLDTNLERLAVVGWYNRIVLPSDVWELASNNNNQNGGGDGMASPQRLGMLAASATLILVGISQLL